MRRASPTPATTPSWWGRPGDRARSAPAAIRATSRGTDALLALRPTRSRPPGSTCCPGCPSRSSRRCTRAPSEPVGPDDLAPLFPMALIEQEMTPAPWVDIPGEVLDVLRLWRPTPLVRAERLEQALGTPARIYYKDESGSPAGSHKPNTAVPQAFYNKAEGITRLTTETGAGQWGTALAFACAAVRPRVQGVHGAHLVRVEALPPGDHGDLGRRVRAVAGRRPVVAGLARPGHLRRRPRRRHPRRHPLLARLGAQPRPAAPDGHRPRGQGAARPGRRAAARRRDRAVRRRLEPRRPRAAVRARTRGVRLVAVEPSSCPTLTEGTLRVRLRRHRRA